MYKNNEYQKQYINELLKTTNGKAFKFLHDKKGFDFEDQFYIFKFETPTSAGKIKKALESNGLSCNENILLLLKHDYWRKEQRITCAEFDGVKIDPITEMHYYNDSWENKFDWLCRKSDFHDKRKTEGNAIYLIWQRASLAKFEQFKTFDTVNGRASFSCIRYSNNKIYEIHAHDKNNKKITFKPWYKHYETDIFNVFDKSGYFLLDRRANLKNRAAAVKTERQKAQADANNNKYIKTADNLLNSLERAINEVFAIFRSKKEKMPLPYTVRYGIADLLNNIKAFFDYANNKKFKSPEEAEKQINKIGYDINKILTEINGDTEG